MKSAPECPRCGKYSIVQQSDTRWTCLNCGFSKNLSHHHSNDSDEESQDGGWFSIFILVGILLIVMVQVVEGQELPQQHRQISTPVVPLEQV
ncbi:hypothetical protein NEA10_06490 [Phormidium yuhuli AB48]|uniref:Transposase n=1 Tax=Phormidium yuhuli AB48 TaxID=2940671 RepID=A0ABY5AT07_9CYAN|nr:hypothetical protein [Phormidium yuhuli]USR92367.1 hypothetical protein NEA10_06490 [Phormidium yuhuli AB48]